MNRLMAVVDRLEADSRLAEAIARQDAVTTQSIVNEALFVAER